MDISLLEAFWLRVEGGDVISLMSMFAALDGASFRRPERAWGTEAAAGFSFRDPKRDWGTD